MPKPRSFTYVDRTSGEITYDLNTFKRLSSDDSLGVWVIWGVAWKIFSHRALWEQVCHQYQTATAHTLIDSRTFWAQVNVYYSDNTWTSGFAIASPFVDVQRTTFRSFNLKHGSRSAKSIIERINNIEALQRIEQAFQQAKAAMLKHPQGFIDTNPSSGTPVMFIDIAIHNKPAKEIADVLEFLEKRIQVKWQRKGGSKSKK